MTISDTPVPLHRASGIRRFAAPGLAALFSASLTLISACGGGGSSSGFGDFVVLKTEPANNGQIFLNQSLKITMSNPIDVTTVNFNSIIFSVFKTSGERLSETVSGSFRIGKDVFGEEDPRLLEFVPHLPTNDTFDNGGFRPDRLYKVSLAAGSNRVAPTMRDIRGRSIAPTSPIQTMVFRTASGTTPQELFLDTKAGGPRVVSWDVTPRDATSGVVGINQMGDIPVEVTLRFNQPVNPSSGNVPLRQTPDPKLFQSREQGKIFLEYDDVEFATRWVPAQVEIPENSLEGATIVLRPDAVIPNNAEIRLIVQADFQDISGESNVKDASYVNRIGSFRTADEFEPVFDAVAIGFQNGDLLDLTAPFRDPVAELRDGLLSAAFDFDGLDTPFDFAPSKNQRQLILRTDVTVVQPRNGPPLTVRDGIFQFNNILIADGLTVRGQGPNPMVFLAKGNVVIDGVLALDGGDGEDAEMTNAAHIPTNGGKGNGGGGDGGRASQNTEGSTQFGETGFGPGQLAGKGGGGGQIHCQTDPKFNRGAGGAGGGHSTFGDPEFYNVGVGTDDITDGKGGDPTDHIGTGKPPKNTPPNGGTLGALVFSDPNPKNNFWGRQITDQGVVINGELVEPLGGSGGGGGGDLTLGAPGVPCDAGSVNFVIDKKGGGGGGAAGVLIIKALGEIRVSKTGLISANGGDGGGGEPQGTCKSGGGGGGGSGGMIVLMSADKIVIQQHDSRWDTSASLYDANFAISADGGIGRSTGKQNASRRLSKYVGLALAKSGEVNRGGFGGLGVIQLMTPPGTDSDKTGSIQDDNVLIVDNNNVEVTGAAKTSWLMRGDLRPAPFLLPVPFSRYSQARTRWIALGATVRRETLPPLVSAGPRSLNKNLGDSGPEYFFWGLEPTGRSNEGYLRVDTKTGGMAARVEVTAEVTGTVPSERVIRGRKVHLVNVKGTPFPVPSELDGWSYSNYRAVLKNGTAVVGDFHIVANTRSSLFLRAEDGPLPSPVTEVEIHARFIEVLTGLGKDMEPGLGPVYELVRNSQIEKYPIANVQIGFAFHKDPSDRTGLNASKTIDTNRLPQEVDKYLTDLDLDNLFLREAIRSRHMPFTQVKFRFNLDYNPLNPDLGTEENELKPSTRRTAVRILLLPCRY